MTGSIILRLGLLCLRLSPLVVTQLPPIVHVPLTASDDNQRYFANVNMSFGPQTQRFGFALSTTTGYTIVANTSCANCTSNNIPTYNSTLSTSAKTIDSGQQQQIVYIAGGTVDAGTGIASKEDCAMRQVNGSFWKYLNQTIIQTNSSNIFQTGVSGLIGLGTNTVNFGDTMFARWLSNNPTLNNFTFALALNPLPGAQAQFNSIDSAGMLHLQQSDPSSYTGGIRWQNVQNVVPNANVTTSSSGVNIGHLEGSSWLIQMDGWSFTAGSVQTNNPQAALAAVEPYFPNIFLPQAHATQLYASLAGSAPLPAGSSDIGQVYSIPCDADFTFTVLLSGYGYLLTKETLVIKAADGSCTGAIEGWMNPTAGNYLLGSRFISTVYVVFQIGQLPAAQQQVGIAQRATNTTKKSIIDKVVGGVVGGVGFLIIINAVAFWWFLRRRKTSSAGTGDIQLRSGWDKTIPEAPGHTIESCIPSPVLGLGTSDSYYPPNTPSTPNSFPHSTKYHLLPVVNSPSGTKTSETILFPGPKMPSVKQWVISLTPNNAGHSPCAN